MNPTEWPRSEYDGEASADANCQHQMYMLEGYRAYVLGGETDTGYSPGSARDISWKAGYAQAEKDQAGFQEALAIVLEHAEDHQWSFETGDGAHSYNYCESCGWNNKRTPPTEPPGLRHKPDCKLKAALDLLNRMRQR